LVALDISSLGKVLHLVTDNCNFLSACTLFTDILEGDSLIFVSDRLKVCHDRNFYIKTHSSESRGQERAKRIAKNKMYNDRATVCLLHEQTFS